MTYLQFHLVFILPPVLVMLWVVHGWLERNRQAVLWLGVMIVIAVLYTTPWDNYLVYRDVWGYGSDRVLLTLGYVPVEEYLFFALQPMLTGLWLYVLLQRGGWNVTAISSETVRWVGGVFCLLLALLGIVLLRQEGTLYLGLILTWASPVLAAQWFYAGHWCWRVRRLWLLAVTAPTIYLWIADRIAIHLGIWHIAERFTTGWHLVGLPTEEALFFLVTNLLLVQGLLMFLRIGAPNRLTEETL